MTDQKRISAGWIAATIGVAFAVALGVGRIYGGKTSAPPVVSEPRGAAPHKAVSKHLPTDPVYKIPVTSTQPSIGPEDALVTLVEWCDLPDRACAEIESAIQALLEAHPSDVRLTFRHYPTGDTTAHQFAQVAFQRGKFWEARALIQQETKPIDLDAVERMAKKIGLKGPETRQAVEAHPHAGHITGDRIFARMFDVRGTPALFANGRPVSAPITAEALEATFQRESARANKLVSKGIARKDVYAELIKEGTWTAPPAELVRAGP